LLINDYSNTKQQSLNASRQTVRMRDAHTCPHLTVCL